MLVVDVCLRHNISCREYSDVHGLHCSRLDYIDYDGFQCIFDTIVYPDALGYSQRSTTSAVLLILLVDCCIPLTPLIRNLALIVD